MTHLSLRIVRWLFGLVSLVVASGCQLLGGVDVETVASTAHPPGQVAVYLAVNEGGKPLSRLSEENFRLTEDEKALDSEQVNLRLLPRDAVAAHRLLVLVDLSGPVDEPGRLALLAKQLSPFVDRLRQQEDVSVYGFDGGEKLYSFGKFEKDPSGKHSSAQALKKLTQHKQADSSSNLNGAMLTALAQLELELQSSNLPIQIGTLAVIARGPDLAGRTTDERVTERMDQVDHHLFALGVENEQNEGFTERFGRDGFVTATSFDNMESQLADLATMLEQSYSQYYLLSYCSPARAGQRTLLVEVSHTGSGGSEQTGDVELTFSADGFRSGCDSSSTPRFRGAPVTPSAKEPSTEAQKVDSDAFESEEPPNDAAAEAEEKEVVPPPDSPHYAP